MRAKLSYSVVGFVVGCLTICHFQVALAGPVTVKRAKERAVKRAHAKQIARSSASVKSIATMASLDPDSRQASHQNEINQELTQIVERHDPKSRNWLTNDQSILFPVPRARMILADFSFKGSTETAEISSRALAPAGKVKTVQTNYGPSLDLKYGISENFYVGAATKYEPGTYEETRSLGAPAVEYKQTTKDNGWREPHLVSGVTGHFGADSRVTGEIDAIIPVGRARTEIRDLGNSTANGLDGGGGIEPRVSAVTRIASVKLVARTGYLYRFERGEDFADPAGNTSSRTVTGGNVWSVTAALELPKAYNLGFGSSYNRREPRRTSLDINPNVAITDEPQSLVLVFLQMGFKIPDTQFILVPKFIYGTQLTRSTAAASIDRSDIFQGLLSGLLSF